MGFVPFMDDEQDYGKKAVKQEKKKQRLIDEGMSRINAVFDGGSYPTYTAASSFDPAASYYMIKDGQYVPYTAPTVPSTGKFTLPEGFAPYARKGKGLSPEDMLKKGRLFTRADSQTFSGFTPEFYNKRASDYVNYAMPQLANQYRNASRATTYGLANRGLLRSGSAIRRRSQLNREYGTQRQSVYDAGRGHAENLRRQVEDSRQQAINQLYQTADPAGAALSATRLAASAQAPSAFAPVANAFSNIANQYYMNSVLNSYKPEDEPNYADSLTRN